MDMDGTMGRRRTQRLANDTWAGPWYEYEYEDADMDGTMGRRRTQRFANDTWAGPWYEYEYEDADTHT